MMKIIFEMDIKEKWKKIKKYPSYAISNFGKIKRIKRGQSTFVGKILKIRIDTNGYPYIRLYKDGKGKNVKIHKLIAETFIGSCPKGKEVNHIDGNKKNSHVDNLEYVTRSENIKHAFKLGLRNDRGENHYLHKLKEKDILKIKKLYGTRKYLQKEIAKMFNCNQQNISFIVNNKTWRHI